MWCILNIKYRTRLLPFYPLIPQHPTINPRIFTLEPKLRLGRDGLKHEMIIAVWAVLVGFLEFLSVFAEGFFAFFAGEGLGDWLVP